MYIVKKTTSRDSQVADTLFMCVSTSRQHIVRAGPYGSSVMNTSVAALKCDVHPCISASFFSLFGMCMQISCRNHSGLGFLRQPRLWSQAFVACTLGDAYNINTCPLLKFCLVGPAILAIFTPRERYRGGHAWCVFCMDGEGGRIGLRLHGFSTSSHIWH